MSDKNITPQEYNKDYIDLTPDQLREILLTGATKEERRDKLAALEELNQRCCDPLMKTINEYRARLLENNLSID